MTLAAFFGYFLFTYAIAFTLQQLILGLFSLFTEYVPS